MTTKIGINGFGRIGRKVARLALERDDIEIVAINNLDKPEVSTHLFKYDSVHGTLPYTVKMEGDSMIIETKKGLKKIKMFSEKDPANLPWGSVGATIVHECTGIFTDKEKASLHMKGGAKRVIISAPSKDADITLCMGVNEKAYDPSKHTVVSNASCTTNCLAPIAKVLHDTFGIKRGTMMTVHSYTNDQNILDLGHKDLRRARAGAVSMIPTTTGAAKAVGLVLPELKGKLDGLSIRVPTPNVSLVDLTCELGKTATKEEINAAFKSAAAGAMKGVLGTEAAPLVSHDYNGNVASSTVDLELTAVIDGNFAKVISWYDNESGFSARMLDLTAFIAAKGI
ncbi:MAG: type I glyceraldehyde-3-phosphate dehydrogenase [Bdellovibrionales bacterium]|nr:type I glyceraldehyde-3-phosphate dehydrogenase [Bdellovibrionales bacterium]